MIMYMPLIIQGVGITCASWILAGSIGLLIGVILGIASCHYLDLRIVRICVRIYTFITKGIPAYVQILIAYFFIPSLLHISIPGFFAASCALALCSSGYVTEIVRAGINAIPRGQWEACFVLGYPLRATIQHIIAPQTIRIILPALMGECEQLLKSTSLLATIGVTELTRAGMNIISRELDPFPIYTTIACIYLLFSGLLTLITIYAEKRMRARYHV